MIVYLSSSEEVGAVTSHRPNSDLGSGGPGSKGPVHILCRGRQEKHTAGAVEGGVEQRVRRAAQRRRLPGAGHHVREGAARAEPAQPSSGHQQSKVLHSAHQRPTQGAASTVYRTDGI